MGDESKTADRRRGKSYAMAQIAKATLASGQRVEMWSKSKLVEVVGIVDDPDTRLLEQKDVTNNEH